MDNLLNIYKDARFEKGVTATVVRVLDAEGSASVVTLMFYPNTTAMRALRDQLTAQIEEIENGK